MAHQVIKTANAPAPIGPYNQAILAGSTLYISGQIALDPASGELLNESVAMEAAQVMKNLNAVLEAAGMSFADVVKTTIYLTDMALFNEVNEIYKESFTSNNPARETVAVVGLPKNVNVEISMIAVK